MQVTREGRGVEGGLVVWEDRDTFISMGGKSVHNQDHKIYIEQEVRGERENGRGVVTSTLKGHLGNTGILSISACCSSSKNLALDTAHYCLSSPPPPPQLFHSIITSSS